MRRGYKLRVLWGTPGPCGSVVDFYTPYASIDKMHKTQQRRLERLTPKRREYLRAMTELGAGPHRSGDIASELGVRVESLAPRRSGLIQKGMIFSPAHSDTAFTVRLFDDVKRVLP